jgi:aerobic-type carbon monoxide dehydrogenase small subunit (CoxS/CutS family)
VKVHFTLNDEPVEVEARADQMLLGVLNGLGQASVRETCGIGVCGACTVLRDGEPVSACLVLAPLAEGHEITTVEGLEGEHRVQRAFAEAHAFQCGYCTPGMILTAKRLLEENPRPSEEEVRVAMSGNLCRCGSYVKIVDAVLKAAKGTGSDPVNSRGQTPLRAWTS